MDNIVFVLHLDFLLSGNKLGQVASCNGPLGRAYIVARNRLPFVLLDSGRIRGLLPASRCRLF